METANNDRILYGMLYDMRAMSGEVFKTEQGLAMLSPQTPLWIWLTQEGTDVDARVFFRAFLRQNNSFLIGLVAKKDIARACTEIYLKEYGGSYNSEEIISYFLPKSELKNLSTTAKGELRLPNAENAAVVFSWIEAFYKETLHANMPQPSTEKKTESSAKTTVSIWWNEKPVAMGMVLDTGSKTSRLNLIYTPPDERGKGYGRALVTALAAKIHENGQVPILYTETRNEGSNKLYKSIGFKEAGRLLEVRFK